MLTFRIIIHSIMNKTNEYSFKNALRCPEVHTFSVNYAAK